MSSNDQRASLAFKNGNADSSVRFGTNAIDCLKQAIDEKIIPDAGTMPVPLDTLEETNNDLAAANAKALSGNFAAKAAVKKQLPLWRQQFGETANFVSGLADGDEEMIYELGFVATKGTKTRKKKPAQIIEFMATINGKKGTIIAKTKKKVDASAYGYVAAPAGATIAFEDNTVKVTMGGQSVYFMVCTQRKAEFYNMPGQQQFNVCMYGVNAAGSGPASDIQDVTPQ